MMSPSHLIIYYSVCKSRPHKKPFTISQSPDGFPPLYPTNHPIIINICIRIIVAVYWPDSECVPGPEGILYKISFDRLTHSIVVCLVMQPTRNSVHTPQNLHRGTIRLSFLLSQHVSYTLQTTSSYLLYHQCAKDSSPSPHSQLMSNENQQN